MDDHYLQYPQCRRGVQIIHKYHQDKQTCKQQTKFLYLHKHPIHW